MPTITNNLYPSAEQPQAAAVPPAGPRPVWTKILTGLLLFSLLCFAVYLFSPYTKIQALICSGNYYYSPQQVYAIAGLSVNNRTFLHPVGQIEKTLESNPLIESASVTREGRNLQIDVQEKTIIGYYEKDGANYLVSSKGERIPIENEAELRTLVHFPLLADLNDETISQIVAEIEKHPDLLTRSVFEKIAEILPWEESYDKNMLKLVLQDGNTVFTSISSLFMMSTYQQVLSNLQGESVCLLLDGQNGVVNKIACDYMYLSPEKRAENREIPKSILTSEMLPEGSEEAEKKALKEKAKAEAEARGEVYVDPDAPQSTESAQPADGTGSAQNGQADPAAAQAASESAPAASEAAPAQPAVTLPSDPGAVTDWEASAVPGIQHSPSLNLFYSPENGLYYTYDEASDTLYPVLS